MANTPSESRKFRWLVALLLVVTLFLAATNIYLLVGRDDTPDGDPASPDLAAEPETPIFVDIAPFTVNLQTDGYGNRLLYTGVSLQVGDERTREFLLQHMPQLRSRLLTLFSGQEAATLISPEGKKELSTAVLAMLAEPLASPQPDLAVRDVLFTEFIVQ